MSKLLIDEPPLMVLPTLAVHTSLNEVGALATTTRARGLALVRLRPPPFYEFQYRTIVRRSFDGTVLVPEDGDALYP